MILAASAGVSVTVHSVITYVQHGPFLPAGRVSRHSGRSPLKSIAAVPKISTSRVTQGRRTAHHQAGDGFAGGIHSPEAHRVVRGTTGEEGAIGGKLGLDVVGR